MRWPVRRSPSPDPSTNPSADPVEASNPATDAAPAAPSPESGAWRDLPAGLPVLGAMPSVTDAGFSRSLPSRWHNPPALGPLGHDVRTDVPGGLVSGVARTVDPLDTRPADFVWRVPEAAHQATAADQDVSALTQTTAARTVAAPTTATTAAAPSPLVPVISQTSVPPSGSPARSGAEPGADTGAPASPDGGTAQTRQALPDAVTAVEARDPRPVPADVTDGLTAAAPDRGVHAEPQPGTSESPPDSPAAGFGALLTPREARPGPDPPGSAPAVAPLVARNPLPRASAQPLIGAPETATPQARADAAIQEPIRTGLVAAGPANGEPTTAEGPAESTSADAAESSAIAPLGRPAATSAYQAADSDLDGQSARAAEAAGEPERSAAPSALMSAAEATAGLVVTRTAPLVSATRFGPAASAISVLRPPAAPVDQPVRTAESAIGGFAIASPATVAPSPATAAASLAPEAAAVQTAAARATTESATAADSAMRATGPLRTQAQNIAARATTGTDRAAAALQATEAAASRTGRPGPIGETGAPNASPSTATAATATAVTPHDPAALDTLARQLYGRFSRHLAGELLIDRERAQFLTDLH